MMLNTRKIKDPVKKWTKELNRHFSKEDIQDLTDTEEIKKRWQEYTRTVQKGLNDPDNYDGVVTL